MQQKLSLLREIQEAATDSTIDISTVLRKAKILAARLQNPDFETWIDHELNGYEGASTVPPYRRIGVVVQATISDGYRQWDSAPVMTSFLPEKLQAWGAYAALNQPISAIAAMVSRKDGQLQAPWPQEMAVKYGAKGYNGFECLGARQVINPSSLVGIVEQVRNRVLEFALKIEAAAPEAGETPVGAAAPISQEKITQIFNTYVYGNSNNVAPAGSHVSQHSAATLQQGDLDSLLKYLREIGISDAAVGELQQATDSQPDKKAAAEGWLGKLAMSGATAATGAVFSLAAKAVAHYFGMTL